MKIMVIRDLNNKDIISENQEERHGKTLEGGCSSYDTTPKNSSFVMKISSRLIPSTYDEVFQCMFDYIEDLVIIVCCRKLLYIGIYGVTSREKMNQLCSRRF